MKIYYDTEFIEDGRTIELISIGMVCENGAELYCVNKALSLDRLFTDLWHYENTVPSLPVSESVPDGYYENVPYWDRGHPDYPRVMPRAAMRKEITTFISNNLKETGDDEVRLWAWYGAYDHVALAQIWGRMRDLPYPLVPMYTNDLRQELDRVSDDLNIDIRLPEQPDGLHNALADARWLKYRAKYLERLASQ